MPAFNTTQWGGTPITGAVCWTARQMIYRALRDLKALRPGQEASSDTLQDGLDALNELLDSWNIERLMIRVVSRDLVKVDGNPSYVVQPWRIEGIGYVDVYGSESPIELIPYQRRQEISGKDTSPNTPSVAYLDNAWPDQNMHPNPVPDTGEFAIYQWQALDFIDGLDTEYCFPAGYAAAIRWNLARYLAPSVASLLYKGGDVLLDMIVENAKTFKARIKSYNSPSPTPRMACDPALLGATGRAFISGNSGSGSALLGAGGGPGGRTWDQSTQTWVNTTTTWEAH